MKLDLDDLLPRLRAEPADRDLSSLEPQVWARIDGRRQGRLAPAMFAHVRAGAVIAALGIGMVAGGASAVERQQDKPEVGAFSVASGLAPSTLLGG